MDVRDALYDWNVPVATLTAVEIHDETLRDGLQSPTVRDPGPDAKCAILRQLDRLGVDSVNVGLPGAGPRARRDAAALLRTLADEGLRIRPSVAARTHPGDVQATLDLVQSTGVPLEAMLFLGSSPLRMLAESWDEDEMVRLAATAVGQVVQAGLAASFVTEDTVRSRPETLERLFHAALDAGASRLVLCDTVGHATPSGVCRLVEWTRALLRKRGQPEVGLDWHGHDDRGLSLINALDAADAGVGRLHGTVLGVGERVGNTPLDLLLVNLKLLSRQDTDLQELNALVKLVAEAYQVPIPHDYPVFGADAFRTATGVHAAAVVKAQMRGQHDLADVVYASVPARWVGRTQEIAIGPMSGGWNVRAWLAARGIAEDDALIEAILSAGKAADMPLGDDAIGHVVAALRGEGEGYGDG